MFFKWGFVHIFLRNPRGSLRRRTWRITFHISDSIHLDIPYFSK